MSTLPCIPTISSYRADASNVFDKYQRYYFSNLSFFDRLSVQYSTCEFTLYCHVARVKICLIFSKLLFHFSNARCCASVHGVQIENCYILQIFYGSISFVKHNHYKARLNTCLMERNQMYQFSKPLVH